MVSDPGAIELTAGVAIEVRAQSVPAAVPPGTVVRVTVAVVIGAVPAPLVAPPLTCATLVHACSVIMRYAITSYVRRLVGFLHEFRHFVDGPYRIS